MYLNSKFNFDGLPVTAGRMLWRQSDLIDLFILATTSEDTVWFSNNVFRIPRKFSMECVSQYVRQMDHWLFRATFPDGRIFSWYIYYFSAKVDDGRLLLKVGDQKMWTKMKEDENGKSLHSWLVDYQTGLFKIIGFMEKLFRSPLTEIKLNNCCHLQFPQLQQWKELCKVKTLILNEFSDYSFLEKLVIERNKRNLRTTIVFHQDYGILSSPLSCLTLLELESIDCFALNLSLQHLPLEKIFEYLERSFSRDFEYIRALLPAFPRKQLSLFKEVLKLDDCWGLDTKYAPKPGMELIGRRFRKFTLKMENGTCLVFFFFSPYENLLYNYADPPHVYNRITVQKWFRKPHDEVALPWPF
ncbi:unnamed protein product [Caenorhabditis brenneri]